MPLNPIGDIANPTLSEGGGPETVTWETASDWDSAVAEDRVVHEAFGDLVGDGTIQLGYETGLANLIHMWSLYEDSGTGFEDHVAGADSSHVNAPSLGNTGGVLNFTYPEFDGSNDYSEVPNQASLDQTTHSIAAWVYWPSSVSDGTAVDKRQDGGNANDVNYQFVVNNAQVSNAVRYTIGTGSNFNNVFTNSFSADTWQFIVGTYDGSNQIVYRNGTQEASQSPGFGSLASGGDFAFGANPTGGFPGNVRVNHVMLFDTDLSSSQVSNLYDVSSNGTLTTGTKSFPSSVQPDLQNLDYTLNGETIDLDIIGSPGTGSEETVTQSLGGASSYTLSWVDSHTDFRVDIQPSTTDVTASPTVNRVELVE